MGAALGHPGEAALEDGDGEIAVEQVPHSEGEKRTVGRQVGTEEDARHLDS